MMYRIAGQGKRVPLFAEGGDDSVLEQRLRSARRWHIEYGGFLTNHLTHGWVVMALGGASTARLDWWESVYADPRKVAPLEPARHEPGRIAPPTAAIEALLGCGMAQFPALQLAFDRELATLGRVGAAQRYVPALSPGLAGAAFHPLIHLGLGLEAASDSMVADALAYWTCVYQPLGTADPRYQINPVATTVASPAEQLFAQLTSAKTAGLELEVAAASESPAIVARQRGSFQQRLMTFANPAWPMAAWLDEAGALQLPAAATMDLTLHQLRVLMTQLLQASENEFFVLHALTSCYALGKLLPILPPEQGWVALAAWYRGALATLIGQRFPGIDQYYAVKVEAGPEPDWQILRARSWLSRDEHVPKAVYALSVWAQASADAAARCSFAAAARGLLQPQPDGELGQNLRFSD